MRSVVVLCLSTVAAAQSFPDFDDFAKSFARSYDVSTPEYHSRRSIYESNVAKGLAQNNKPNRLWTAGTNELWDWDAPELTRLLGWSGGARPSETSGGSRSATIQKVDFLQKNNKTAPLPDSKSWAHLQTSKHIKNQGACGSCWAIAAVTTLQAATEIHSAMRTFSAQEMVNCVPNPQECGGQGGCRGATVELALDWVMKHDISQEYQVKYLGWDNHCANTAPAESFSSFGMQGWEMLPRNKMEPLMRAIAFNGPTAVSADASTFHMYEHGIFDGCTPDAIINHAVTAIGYGADASGTKFWHIQNSWGDNWGEQGTIRLLRQDNDDTNCGIDNKPEMGSGCKGGPSQVTVCGMCGVLYDSVTVHMRG